MFHDDQVQNMVFSFELDPDFIEMNTLQIFLFKIYCKVGIIFVDQLVKPDQVAATLAKKRNKT